MTGNNSEIKSTDQNCNASLLQAICIKQLLYFCIYDPILTFVLPCEKRFLFMFLVLLISLGHSYNNMAFRIFVGG